MDSEEPKIRTPLRYPGGKSRAVKIILPLVPDFEGYREPMVGGGSILFALKQEYPERKYWINDKNTELYLFWKFCKENPTELISEIKKFKKKYPEGKKLYLELKKGTGELNPIQRAARFFILNRISFSGLADSGGYSNQAYCNRFTESSVQRILPASKLLQGVKITNYDYGKVIREKGTKVFIFLDPPYYSKTQSKLYGKNGELHTIFNHDIFSKSVKKCKHKWLITYDDCSKVNKLFSSGSIASKGWQKTKWKLQYGTNNLKEKKAKIGDELFISNFAIPSLQKWD